MPKIVWETGVYCWRNKVNGKVYVGGAYRSFKIRRRGHENHLKRGTHPNVHLQAAWDMYGGLEGFEWQVLERCPLPVVEERETWWIAELKAADREYGYNTRLIAGSCLGVKRTEEAKAKMSAAKKGLKLRLGAVVSEETRRKIGDANRGKKRTAETRANISEAQKRRSVESAPPKKSPS